MTLGPLTNLAIAVLMEPELPRLLRALGPHGRRVPRPRQHVAGRPSGTSTATRRRRRSRSRPGRRRSIATRRRPARSRWASTSRSGRGSARTTSWRSRVGPARTADDSLDPDRAPGDPERRSVASNPVVRFVADALRFYFEFHARYDGFYGAFIHDPLVVAAALDPSLVRTEPVAVDVDTSGGAGDGQTIADVRGLWGRTTERGPRRGGGRGGVPRAPGRARGRHGARHRLKRAGRNGRRAVRP